MSDRFIEPVSRMTVTMMKPIETS